MLDLILMIIIGIHDGLSRSQEVGHHGDCLGYRQQITCLEGLSIEFCCCCGHCTWFDLSSILGLKFLTMFIYTSVLIAG